MKACLVPSTSPDRWDRSPGQFTKGFGVYSFPEVDRIWLWVYHNKIPIYFIFDLLKGDYRGGASYRRTHSVEWLLTSFLQLDLTSLNIAQGLGFRVGTKVHLGHICRCRGTRCLLEKSRDLNYD